MLIAHLSDPHVCPPGTLYQGLLDSNARFAAAVDQVRALDPDLVILTGDIAEHGDPAEYALASQILSRLTAPLLAIPGNHDDRAAFRAGLSGLIPTTRNGPLHCIAEGAIRVIGLDVTVSGQHHGQIDASHAEWLDTTLAAVPDTPTLLMLHQPPFATGIGFIDTYRCFGEDRLADVLHRHPQVLRLLCGHVHRFILTEFAGRPALTAPTTATSLALRLTPGAMPASYTEPPAMLIHLWRDGALVSHLQPLGSYPGPHEFF
ncbi:phosphodiesterase [Tabrizicola sp.]|uniref:phosphodiesterase n=1 Tax=Tabrizicola sp. TaxID=2005166 RepID=UPI00286AFA7D|nr:phosphodiesterase [Tabrizicola sp.]